MLQSQAAGKVHLWLGIAFPTWQGLEYGSYGSFAAAEPEEGHAMMTDSAQAIQQAALSQGFKPQQQPSGTILPALGSSGQANTQPLVIWP